MYTYKGSQELEDNFIGKVRDYVLNIDPKEKEFKSITDKKTKKALLSKFFDSSSVLIQREMNYDTDNIHKKKKCGRKKNAEKIKLEKGTKE